MAQRKMECKYKLESDYQHIGEELNINSSLAGQLHFDGEILDRYCKFLQTKFDESLTYGVGRQRKTMNIARNSSPMF